VSLEIKFPVKSHLPPYFRLIKAIVGDLFDVVHHAIQQPLDIYFGFSSESKAIQALVGSDVGKDRFGHGKPLWINLSPQFTVDLTGHSPGKVGEFHRNRYTQIFSFALFISDTLQSHGTTLAILFLCHIDAVHQTNAEGFFRYPSESFALWALVVIGGLLVLEIL
jgi:hypothetical protein